MFSTNRRAGARAALGPFLFSCIGIVTCALLALVASSFLPRQAHADASVNYDSIRSVVIAHLSDIRSCFDPFRKDHPGTEGKVYVTFTIGDTGHVRRATIDVAKSTVKDEALHTCMLDTIRTWKFPETHSGEEADVTYPFELSK